VSATGPVRYTVTAEFDDRAVLDEWIAWLRDGHLAEVLAGGAEHAEVILLDREPDAAFAAEVRYRFRDRGSLASYLRDHAPRLREEGLRRFPPSRGVRYRRTTGEVAPTPRAEPRAPADGPRGA